MQAPDKRLSTSATYLGGLLLFAIVLWFALPGMGVKLELPGPQSDAGKIEIPKTIQWVPVHLASNEAEKSHRAIFCIFTAQNCKPCRRLEREVLNDHDTAEYINKTFVPVIVINDESLPDSAPERMVKRSYDVNTFPTLLITDPDGRRIAQKNSYSSKQDALKFLYDFSKLPEPKQTEKSKIPAQESQKPDKHRSKK